MTYPSQGNGRPALSLLEVLVALAIFLFALIAIGQLTTLAGDRALDVQQQQQAIQLCQSKLAEVVAGVVPLSAQSEQPFEEDAAWQWSLSADQGSVAGLWTVTVRVSRQRPDGSRIETSLSQMVLDPSLRGNNSSGTATSSTSSSTDSSTGGSTTPSAGAATTPSSGTNSPTGR